MYGNNRIQEQKICFGNQKLLLFLHALKGCPDGGIGRRAGLKHQCQQWRAGSTPALGTRNIADFNESAFLLQVQHRYNKCDCFPIKFISFHCLSSPFIIEKYLIIHVGFILNTTNNNLYLQRNFTQVEWKSTKSR